MARGHWHKHRYQVYYHDEWGFERSQYAATERRAIELARASGGRAVECDGDVQVWPPVDNPAGTVVK